MNNKIKLILYYIFVISLTIYLGFYASTFDPDMHTFNEFLKKTLNNFQKYAFNISIFVVIYLYLKKVPFLKPELRIRLNNNLYSYAIKNALRNSFVLSIFIYACYFLTGLIYNYPFSLSTKYITTYITLFSFIFACHIIYYIFYIKTEILFLSVMSPILINLIMYGLVESYNYFINFLSLSKEEIHIIFLIYIIAVDSIGWLYLMFNIDKKESLK